MSSICSYLNCNLNIGAVATPVNPVENDTPFLKLKVGLFSSITSSEELKEEVGFDLNKDDSTVSITVVGASGDLAKKKIFPALFALYYEDCLPKVWLWFSSLLYDLNVKFQ